MLLQIEIIVRIASILILIGLPLVWLWRRWTRPNEVIVDESLITQGSEEPLVARFDEFVDDQEEEYYEDPVIASMHEEDEQYAPIEEVEEIVDQPVIQPTPEAQMTYAESDPEPVVHSQTQSQTSTTPVEQVEPLTEPVGEAPQVPVIVQETMIDIVDVDIDGDGIVDETIMTQVTITPEVMSEAKRQRSFEILQFELRNTKERGHKEGYEKRLIEARALHPERAEFTTMLAEHYYEQAEYRKALGLYRKLVELDSHDDKSIAMMANCYIKVGERENAQVILEKLVQTKSENPRYWMSLAEVYYHNKDIDRTIDCVRMMVKLRPTNMDYLSTLAQLYHETVQYDLYVQILYRMLEIDPLNHEIKSEIEKYSQ